MQTTDKNTGSMWKKSDVMQFLGIGKTLFYQLLHEDMPHYVIGNTYRFKREEIEAWVNEKKVAQA